MTTDKTGQTYLDMVRGFGDKLGLPQIDVEKLIEANRKNLDALNESAVAAAGGAQAVVRKQREMLEAGLREATTLVRGYQPLGDPKETLAKQTEFAKKLFELAVQGAKESAQTTRESTTEATKILQDRMKAALEEVRATVSPANKTKG
jgi:phasin family protein